MGGTGGTLSSFCTPSPIIQQPHTQSQLSLSHLAIDPPVFSAIQEIKYM